MGQDYRPPVEECSDLEYDLAHDATGPPAVPERRPPSTTYVATESDYDGDYSYDLAHDIPRQQAARPDESSAGAGGRE